MWKSECLLSVLKRSYICYYIVCITVPLMKTFNDALRQIPTKTKEIIKTKETFMAEEFSNTDKTHYKTRYPQNMNTTHLETQ